MSFPHGPVFAPTGLINVRVIQSNETKRAGSKFLVKHVTIAAIFMINVTTTPIIDSWLDLFSFNVIERVLYDAIVFGTRRDVGLSPHQDPAAAEGLSVAAWARRHL
jgi:hypothetical protein